MKIFLCSLLNIDVNVTRNDIELAEEETDNELNGTAMETNENRLENDEDAMKHPVAETLDICMEIMCDYFHRMFCEKSALSKSSQNALFSTIIRLFDVHILPTNNVQSVQYIIFYICSFNVSICKAISHELINECLFYRPNSSTSS